MENKAVISHIYYGDKEETKNCGKVMDSLYSTKQVLSKLEYFNELISRLKPGVYTDILVYEAQYAKQYLKGLSGSCAYSMLSDNSKDIIKEYYSFISMWLKGLPDTNYLENEPDSMLGYIIGDKLTRLKDIESNVGDRSAVFKKWLGVSVLPVTLILLAFIGCVSGITPLVYWCGTSLLYIIYYLIMDSAFNFDVAKSKLGDKIVFIGISVSTLLIPLITAVRCKYIPYMREVKYAEVLIVVQLILTSILYIVLSMAWEDLDSEVGEVDICDRKYINRYRIKWLEKQLKKNNQDKDLLNEVKRVKKRIRRTDGKKYYKNLAKAELLYEGCLLAGLVRECDYGKY